MKTSSFNALAATAAFFALCVSAVAFDGVSDASASPQDDFANDPPAVAAPPVAAAKSLALANAAALKARTAVLKAAAARAASQKAAAAAVANLKQTQSRVSVVSSTPPGGSPSFGPADTSSVPAARVRVVLPGSPKPKQVTPVRGVAVTPDETLKTAVAPPKPVVKPQPIVNTTPSRTDDSSKIPDAVKGLVGNWTAVARQGDGELSTVELQLDNHGWAKLTVPNTDGKPSTTTNHKVEYKDNELELTSENGTISLGKLVSSDSRQLVLEQATGLLTFVRP